VTAYLEKVSLKQLKLPNLDGLSQRIETDNFIPLFGLSPKLGPIANWGLEIEKNAIKVNNALIIKPIFLGFCYWRCKYLSWEIKTYSLWFS